MLPRNATCTLLVVLLHFAGFSFQAFAAEEPKGPECGQKLEATRRTILQVKQEQILNFPSSSWVGWHLSADGRAILGALVQGRLLSAFEPLKSQAPLLERDQNIENAVWADEGGQAALYTQDPQGQMFRFSLAGDEAAVSLASEAAIAVFVPADIGQSLVVSAGDIRVSRVRIMPVGSLVPAQDVMAAGDVQQVLIQRESAGGRVLAAIKSQRRLEVFDLNAPGRGALYSVALSDGQSVQPQWLTDSSGNSILIYIDGGVLFVDDLGANRYSYPLLSPGHVSFEAALTIGMPTVVLQGEDGHNSIVRLVDGHFVVDGQFSSAPGQALTLLQEGERALVAFVDPVTRLFVVTELDQSQQPLLSLSLREGEKVAGFAQAGVMPGRHLLAIRTDRNVYVLDVQASHP